MVRTSNFTKMGGTQAVASSTGKDSSASCEAGVGRLDDFDEAAASGAFRFRREVFQRQVRN